LDLKAFSITPVFASAVPPSTVLTIAQAVEAASDNKAGKEGSSEEVDSPERLAEILGVRDVEGVSMIEIFQRCEVSYYIGLKAQSEGRCEDASDWYRISVETGLINNGEYRCP
jgi:hypothetical protein